MAVVWMGTAVVGVVMAAEVARVVVVVVVATDALQAMVVREGGQEGEEGRNEQEGARGEPPYQTPIETSQWLDNRFSGWVSGAGEASWHG